MFFSFSVVDTQHFAAANNECRYQSIANIVAYPLHFIAPNNFDKRLIRRSDVVYPYIS